LQAPPEVLAGGLGAASAQGVDVSNLSDPPVAARVWAGEYLPALDGLRALSIGLVLIGHVLTLYPTSLRAMDVGFVLGRTGVSVFFVISGYLITGLLLREEEKRGQISLRRFYARRALRIFPAAFVFLATLLVLWLAGWIVMRPHDFVASVFYVRNLTGGGHETGHLWSLSLEEQFYLLWPLTLLLLRPGRRLAAVSGAIIAVCMWRTYLILAHKIDPWVLQIRTDVRADTILVGCLLALLVRRFPQLRLDRGGWTGAWIPIAAGAAVLAAALTDPQWMHFAAVQSTLVGLLIGALLLWILNNPGSSVTGCLQVPVALVIGKLSYSLYLWQQLFLGPREGGLQAVRWFPLNLVLTIVFASASYLLVERPALRLKARNFGVHT
jgi:peptidoglycan/LPS O-acetylase OafA/YrhL